MKTRKKKNICDLFLCTTPLQMLIAQKIIESPSYDGDRPDLVLAALSESEKYNHYYEQLSKLCRFSIRLERVKFPFYLYYIARYFFLRRYRRIYLASIDSSFLQTLTSYLRFSEIMTFDDGTANISKDSIYYHDQNDFISKSKRLIFRLAGNRYSRKKFITETLNHYTIYPNFKNITEKVEHLDLVGNPDAKEDSCAKKATIVLGTCYRQVVKSPDLEKVFIGEFERYVESIKSSQTFYISHPRDEREIFNKIETISDQRISEETIAELIKTGYNLTLIGFGSSVQFAFLNNRKVVNLALTSPHLKNLFNDLAKDLIKHGGKAIDISKSQQT